MLAATCVSQEFRMLSQLGEMSSTLGGKLLSHDFVILLTWSLNISGLWIKGIFFLLSRKFISSQVFYDIEDVVIVCSLFSVISYSFCR